MGTAGPGKMLVETTGLEGHKEQMWRVGDRGGGEGTADRMLRAPATEQTDTPCLTGHQAFTRAGSESRL